MITVPPREAIAALGNRELATSLRRQPTGSQNESHPVLEALASSGAVVITSTPACPLGQIRFAQRDGARVAQALSDKRIPRYWDTLEHSRAGRRLHTVGSFDVVFDDHGDPVQRAARTALWAPDKSK